MAHPTSRAHFVTDIFDTQQSFTFALYYLAANPKYILPLRQEVETILAQDGWSKASLQKMRKIDSFMKECQRIAGFNLCKSCHLVLYTTNYSRTRTLGFMTHKVLQDFTFSDGTFVPKDDHICTAIPMTHHNEDLYDNAREFNPWRFSDMRDETGEGTKHQMVNTTPEYLVFGLGRHAWYASHRTPEISLVTNRSTAQGDSLL